MRIEKTIWRICEPLRIGSSVTGRSSPCTRMTGGEPDGEVQVGAAPLDDEVEQVVDVQLVVERFLADD